MLAHCLRDFTRNRSVTSVNAWLQQPSVDSKQTGTTFAGHGFILGYTLASLFRWMRGKIIFNPVLPSPFPEGQSLTKDSSSGLSFLQFHCHNCGRDVGFPSRPRTFSERYLLPLLLVRPVRCGACFRRSYGTLFTLLNEQARSRETNESSGGSSRSH